MLPTQLKFFDLFDDINIENKEIYDLLNHIKINYVNVYKKSKRLDVYAVTETFIDRTQITKIEDLLQEHYNVKVVNIYIKYNIEITEEFLIKYCRNIELYLLKHHTAFKGFVKEDTFFYRNNTIYIQLPKTGTEIFNSNSCLDLIKELISYEISTEIKIVIKSIEECLQSDYYIEKHEEEKKVIGRILKKEEKRINNKKVTNSVSNSNIIIGKKINASVLNIFDLNSESGIVVIEGEVFNLDIKDIKGDKSIFIFSVTDFTSSILVKRFVTSKQKERFKKELTVGGFFKIRGEVQYDKYENEIVLIAYDIEKSHKEKRRDNADNKRVELHTHTHMSAMDGVCSVKKLIKTAADWGHKAIAITDHGVVQAYPDAYLAGKDNNIKIIYGIECYLVNDSIPVVYNIKNMSLEGNYVVFDIETTGLNYKADRITEIGAVKIVNNKIVDRFNTLINPQIHIPEKITKLTGITDEMVKDAPLIDEALESFLKFSKGCVLVAHNAKFDVSFVKKNCIDNKLDFDFCYVDTLQLSRILYPKLKSHRLNVMAKHIGVVLENHHRAVDDAEATAHIFINLVNILKSKNINSLDKINSLSADYKDIKKQPYYHAVILVKNYTGLKNMYKIVSKSHLDYFYKKPRVPKSIYSEYKEGLIIGTACEAGELYRALLEGKSNAELEKIAKFYDYLEIQPLENNDFLIRNETVKDKEELKEYNKKIVALGKKLNKLVVATCDVHFIEYNDEVFRRILMAGQGYKDADNQAPLYLRTTEEMLEEFSYLGEEESYRIVVENTNMIADMIEDIKPIPEETFPPEIPGAEKQIQTLAREKAERIYGNPLPKIVKDIMEKELNAIIKNGFSVMYIIAQKLVTKSLSDGYLVGSRGSVGSSFIAFLCDITEVNSLPPHYVCDKCKYSEFITDGTYDSGVDMPDKKCPNCQSILVKDGHNIPFETFLGFDGDKEPDIDLNFSGEYQPIAHKYTEELFGKDNVFRAGTIGTIAEKTAFGFVKNYFDDRNIVINNAEINRLVKGCTGVKRTTGQHPGGVMIVPKKKDIFEFCPIQRPADDVNSDIITTHFDYHSISGRLLKLDILGHDDPTVIKMLEDLSGVKAKEISLSDKKTMSIFTSTKELGISEEDINCKVGTFGIPEFGTRFVRQMLVDTKPKTFAELVKISGLSHGTDVWLNNAQILVRNNIADLSEVICTRDDIMVYLMQKGVDSKHSFKIMESVRKGRGLTEEDEKIMRKNKIPDWYIDSCKKIKYMFPKAHAVAYVTMAYRIAYYKVHYPIDFYIAYFTVRADDFDAELMINGKQKVENLIKELESKGNKLSQKEKNTLTILEVCNEMYARNINFCNVDLYKSDPVKFLKMEDRILPPLSSLQGVGINAAKNIAKERKNGDFISIDDLRVRTKVTKTVIEALQKNGCLNNMPETNQMSLF